DAAIAGSLLTGEDQNVRALLRVSAVSAAHRGLGPRDALGFPVQLVGRDHVVVVPSRRRELAFGLAEGDEENIRAMLREPANSFPQAARAGQSEGGGYCVTAIRAV